MAPPQLNTGLFVGLNKGHIVTKRELPLRPSSRKLGTHKRAKRKREEMSNVLRKMRSAGVSEKKK
uniref:60S ribosomal protein L36 homolog n=1 Tax=Allium cepa TaxID=4679 RepID=Q8S8Z4_ALLCE|nr:60S ribosomal protein L36 homolog [Allium cepa]